MSAEVKKCPEWHVYNSDMNECPYCSGGEIEDELEKLPPNGKMPPPMACCYAPRAWDDDEPRRR